MEWLLAVGLAPIGMWLGWLRGASGNRVAVAASVGGTVGAVLGAVAFPFLFNLEGPPPNKPFWALAGLLIGGTIGTILGAFSGWSGKEKKV